MATLRSPGEICARGRRQAAKGAYSGQKVRAFFEARIEHLTIDDRVRVECLGKMPDGSHCNRVLLIAVQRLLKAGWVPIGELQRYLRCDNRGERGHVDLTSVWADR